MKGTFRVGSVLFVLLALLLAACGQAAPSGSTQTEATNAPAAATEAPAAAAATEAPKPTEAAAAITEPATLRLGYFPNLTHAPALVGVAKGIFTETLGANVTLDLKTFNAGPALIEALFAGEIDIGYIGPNPAINGYVKSNGEALRIIAGSTSGGASFIVRPESGIKAAADLAGKKLATPQLGNTQDVALRFYLQENSLQTIDKGGTVEIVPTQNPDILTLFQQGQIDGAWVPEPWATRLILEAGGEVFVDERDKWPEGQFVTTHVIARTPFISERPDVVAKFLEAHVATIEAINANSEEAKSLVNAEIERITTKPLPREVLDKSYETLSFTFDPLATTLFVSADHAFALGFLGADKPDLSGIYDLDPLNAVLKAKGLPAVAVQ